MRYIAITGVTGMMGIALVRKCSSEEMGVPVFCRKDFHRNALLAGMPDVMVVECGLDELSQCDVPGFGQCDALYHLGRDGSTPSFRDAALTQARNMAYSVDTISFARRRSCGVFAGTVSQVEYGPVNGVIHADPDTHPQSAYEYVKSCVGNLSRIAAEQHRMKYIWMLIFSVYSEYDKDHTLAMLAIGDLLRGKNPACTKAEQIWGYLYCHGADESLFLNENKKKNGDSYPLGAGEVAPLHEYIDTMCSIVRPPVLPLYRGKGHYPHQVMHLESDISLLKEHTGFQLKASFVEGADAVLGWYKREQQI